MYVSYHNTYLNVSVKDSEERDCELWCPEGRCLGKEFVCDETSDCLAARDEMQCRELIGLLRWKIVNPSKF